MAEPGRRPILRSERLFLRPAERDDIPTFLDWLDDADVGEVVSTKPLIGSGTAKTYGVPFILAGDDSYASDHTAGFEVVGTLDVIERITARNLSTTNTARVHLFGAT